MWTQFMDMHSGGGSKEAWEYIYIEAQADEAMVIFYNRFGHNPERVTCTCCGGDYSISENETLEESTAYQRGCRWDGKKKGYIDEPDSEKSWNVYRSLEEYKQDKSVLFVATGDIKDNERTGDVPDEGYMWI